VLIWAEGQCQELPGGPEGALERTTGWLRSQLGWENPVAVAGPWDAPAGLLWVLAPEPPGPAGSSDAAAAVHWFCRWLGEALVSHRLRRELQQAQEDLRALAEISMVAASGLDLKQLLQQIIETVGRVVDAESGGCLLYEPETRQLVLRSPAFGFSDEELVGRYRVPVDGNSNAALVFRTGIPYVSNRAQEDPRLLQHFVRLYRTRSTLSVPLQVGDQRIGVFHVINKRSGEFTARDLRMVELIAPHLAVSIRNAQLYDELRRQHEALVRSRAISEQLTRMVLEGAPLPRIVRAVAEMAGGAVLVMGRGGLIECRGEAPGGLSVPWEGLEAAIRQVLAGRLCWTAGTETVQVAGQPVSLAWVPISTARDHYGRLVVALPGRQPDPIVEQLLQHAATVLALEFLRWQEAWDVERRLKGDLVAELITDRRLSPAEAARRAAHAGLDLSRPLRVAAVEWEGWDSTPGSQQIPTAVARDVFRFLSARWPQVLWGHVNRRTVLLVPEQSPGGAAAQELVEELARFCQGRQATLRWRAGIGRVDSGLEGVRASWRDARDCLEVMRAFGQEGRALRTWRQPAAWPTRPWRRCRDRGPTRRTSWRPSGSSAWPTATARRWPGGCTSTSTLSTTGCERWRSLQGSAWTGPRG
jgi:GAF domain-containing protein